MKKIFAIAASALVLAAPAMSAQGNQDPGPSAGDIGAYLGINGSTVGALPPLATNTLAAGGRMSWHVQYGRLTLDDETNTNSFAGGVDIDVGTGRLGITAGYMTFSCPDGFDCKGHLMLGSRYSRQLTGDKLGTSGGRWQLGFEGELGIGLPEDSRAMAVAVGLPVKLTFGRNVKVSPFITPSFAHGSYKVGDVSESAMKFMFGAGIGFDFANGIGANIGTRKVFVDQGETQYGLGFTIRPRTSRARSGR
jgi:opacity protein-like surface antigen